MSSAAHDKFSNQGTLAIAAIRNSEWRLGLLLSDSTTDVKISDPSG